MGNCLKTQLKESVNNNTLPIFECLYLGEAKKNMAQGIYANLSENAVLIGSDGSRQTYANEFIGDHITEGVYYNISKASDLLNIEINEFDRVDCRGCINVINIIFVKSIADGKMLPVSNNIQGIQFSFSTLENKNDFINWSQKVPLRTLQVGGLGETDFTFTPVELADMGNDSQRLVTITGGWSGDVVDFVNERRTLGQSTGSVALNGTQPNFNGDPSSQGNHTLSWTASTITFDGVTIDA